jgi:regulator of sigma E protease
LDNHDAIKPGAGVTSAAPADTSPTLGDWFKRNGPALVLLAGLFVFLYIWFDWEPGDLWSIVKVILGLGLVIFIHELGHFAVAKWCDVHVETFSIGFGPALPGCKFKYGETTYMIALFPLGGYVKMVGEGSDTEEDEEDPRSFKNKSVWQRMAIISAGVVMNVILAFVCFIVVFQGPGKKQNSAVIGMVVPGSPAWEQQVPTGAWVHQIGTAHEPLYYADLLEEVMASSKGQQLPLVYSVPPQQPRSKEVILTAVKGENNDRPMIGVYGPARLKFPPKRHMRGHDHPVYLASAAVRAEPPFEFEDEIIGSSDPEHPSREWRTLPDDPRGAPPRQKDYFAFARRMRDLAGKPVVVRVKRKGSKEVSIHVPPAYHLTFGLRMQMGQITAVRLNDPKRLKWGVLGPPVVKSAKRWGDIIEQVRVTEPDGKRTVFWFPGGDGDEVHAKPRRGGNFNVQRIDPARLRYELQRWAARVQKNLEERRRELELLWYELQRWAARVQKAARKKDRKPNLKVTLLVRRFNNKNGNDAVPKKLQIDWDARPKWKYAEEATNSSLDSPLALTELGIAYKVSTTVAGTDPRWTGDRKPPLKKGDVITKVTIWYINKKGKEEVYTTNKEDLAADQWAFFWYSYQHVPDVKKITVRVQGSQEDIDLEAREDESWPIAERGWILTPDQRMQRADSVGEALLMGLKDTYGKISQVYKVLRGIITGRISAKNLGGPITITRVAFAIAGENFWEFIYFLGLISINLAVVNFLPIPVLDGGHMIFLIYEKIRGKPASEQVRSGATIVGLLLILSLMVFVIILDINRLNQ